MLGSRKKGLISKQIDRLAVLMLTSSLSIAFVTTIWSIYLETFLKNPAYVGYLSTLFTVVAGVTFIISVPLIEKTSKTRIFMISILLYSVGYFLYAQFHNLSMIISIAVLLAVVGSLKITSFGIIMGDKSKDNSVSRNVSLIYTFFNIAWLVGPLVAGFVAEEYGFKPVFILAAVFMFITLLLTKAFRLKDDRIEKKIDKNPVKNLKEYFKDKNRILIYIIGGGITFWWALIYVYMPIYVIEKGFDDLFVGYFLAGVIIPLVILEYIFGKKTSKVGFKKMFFFGYLIMAVFAFLAFLINTPLIAMLLFVFASIGMAMIEPTAEAYFFDITSKPQRDKFYGPYNTTIDVNSAIASFLGATILFFFPGKFEYVFLFFAISMLIFALISLKIKNVIEGRRK